jgi:hypothetical protein
VLEDQIVGLAEILIQHELAQELEFRKLRYSSDTLKDRAVHKMCLDEWGHPKVRGPEWRFIFSILGTTLILIIY